MMKKVIMLLMIALLAMGSVTAGAEQSVWGEMEIDGTWTERMAINGDVQVHYYCIQLPEQGLLNVVLQSWMEGVSYKLWNEDVSHCYGETYVWSGAESEAANETVSSIYLPKGIYYAEVAQNNNYTGEFRIKADFTSGECNEREPNNPASHATQLNEGEMWRGMIWADDEYDYYAFSINELQTVRIVAKAYMESLAFGLRDGEELEVLDADGKPINDEYLWNGNTAEPSTYVMERSLRPGNYLVMIKKLNDDGIYELRVNGGLMNTTETADWINLDGDKSVWYCPNCGTENRGNFCFNCGTANPRE